MQLSLPQGAYKENNESAGLGGRFNFLWRPKKEAPVKIGAEIGFQAYGNRAEYFDGYVFGFYEQYRVSASNNVISLTLMSRLQSAKVQKIRPFVDAIFGWNVFFSTVNVERLNNYSNYNNYNNDSYGNSSKGRWAFTYGGAAGIDIPLDKRGELGLELKCAYLFGANTKYLTDPRIDNNGAVYFTEKESETNMLIPQLGLRIDIH